MPTVQVAVYEVVVLGYTVRVTPLVPSFHVTLPPQFDTLNVAPLPEQIVGLLTLGERLELTVTVLVTVPEQVPTEQVAVYEVVILGYTVRVAPLVPSFHVTLPPQFDTLNVAPLPEQIVALFTLGKGFEVTLTVPVAVPEHVPTEHVAV